ncbi:hypothetical protein AAFC00_006085 [Neodothiora populina]|uniref:Amino acid permease n=1 Tax=Neodothiora populina TaxID=2781224 RepID=A0ABR3P6U7_9PEZI
MTSSYDPNATSGPHQSDTMPDSHFKKGTYKDESDLTLHDSEVGSSKAPADNMLVVLGYQSELARTRSTLQVAFMSFVLSSIPFGLSTTFSYPLVGGGPAAIIWGWVGVSLIIVCVAVSLGEITSVYPTAGGVYYQAYMLSPPGCRKLLAWICGWSYTLGNVIITLAVNFGLALFIGGCVNIFKDSEGNNVFAAEPYQIFLIFLAITLLCNAVSSLGNKWLPILDTFAIFWTFAGVLAIIVCVLAIAKEGRNSSRYVWGGFVNDSGWTDGWAFCVGLLQAAYATSATGMVISMCEEVKQPSTQVPKALVGTVLLNLVAGVVFLVPLVYVLPDIAALLADPSGQPVPAILASAVGSKGGAFALTIPLIVLGIICGIGCTTAASRCTWAFSRDGAIPGSHLWKQVNPTLGVPLNAMMLSMIVQIALGCIYFGSAAAYNAFSGVGVIFLTVSYAIPIFASMLNNRKQLVGAPFHMGAFGAFCNWISIGWSLLAVPLFCMPSAIPVTLNSMNYASAVYAGFMLIVMVWYYAWGRKNYQGPPQEDHEILQ